MLRSEKKTADRLIGGRRSFPTSGCCCAAPSSALSCAALSYRNHYSLDHLLIERAPSADAALYQAAAELFPRGPSPAAHRPAVAGRRPPRPCYPGFSGRSRKVRGTNDRVSPKRTRRPQKRFARRRILSPAGEMGAGGFEPPKAIKPPDLQSGPIGHSGTRPAPDGCPKGPNHRPRPSVWQFGPSARRGIEGEGLGAGGVLGCCRFHGRAV